MSLKDNKSSIKASSKNEKNSEKERFDSKIVCRRNRSSINRDFTMIRNDMIMCNDMTPECFLLLSYLLSKPEFKEDGTPYDVIVSDIKKFFKLHNCGERKVYKALNNGMSLKYFQRIDILNKKNCRRKCIYLFDNMPVFEKDVVKEYVDENASTLCFGRNRTFCNRENVDGVNNTDILNNTIKKEVVKKKSDLDGSSQNISPTATTSFLLKKKKTIKKQLPFTDDQKDILKKRWGEKIAIPVISRIEILMKDKPNSYTATCPFLDADKFCAESFRVKTNRFTKKVPEKTQKEIEDKNIDAINYIIENYHPNENIFRCSSDTKTADVLIFDSDKTVVLDYTLEDFREKLYKWHEPYRLEFWKKIPRTKKT